MATAKSGTGNALSVPALRILHVTPTYLPATRYGGPIYSVHALCKALAALGHEVHVYTTNVDGDGDSSVPLQQAVEMDGVKVWYFPSRHLRRLYWSPPMGKFLRAHIREFAIVHLHSVFLWPTWAAARAASAAGVPYVLSPRGMLVKELIRRKSWLPKTLWIALIERRTIARAALLHLTSATEREELHRLAFRHNVLCMLENGVEAPCPAAQGALSADVETVITRQSPILLFLGRLNWKKGLDRLIKNLPDITAAHLVIAGNDEDNYLPELQRLAMACGVAERVSFIARNVGGSDKEALFAAAKVFILPSYSENFGNTVPEAMIRGCPVVVSQEVGAAELVRQAQGGYVSDAASLPEAVNALLRDPVMAKRLGEQGRAWVCQRLQWRSVAEKLLAAYGSVLAAGTSASTLSSVTD